MPATSAPPALATVAILLLGTTPAHATTALSTRHIDAFDIDYTGGVLTLDIRNHTVSPVNDDLPAADTQLHVLPTLPIPVTVHY